MHIAIIGSGAMGSLFAARLSRVGDVTLIGRWPAQVAAVRAGGLTLHGLDGQAHVARVPITDAPQTVTADAALVLVKSWQTAQAAQDAQALLTPTGVAVTLQNGLGNRETLAATLGDARVTPGTTIQGATMIGPGVVRHAGAGPTHLAVAPETAVETVVLVTRLRDLLVQAGFETHLSHSVDALLWGKLAVNAAINPLTALLRVRNGFLAQQETTRRMMHRTAAEVATVAQALGIPLPPQVEERPLQVAQATADNYSSMLQDVLRGAPTEIEAICGAVVHYGRLHRVPIPVNETLRRLVLETVENGRVWQLADLPGVLSAED